MGDVSYDGDDDDDDDCFVCDGFVCGDDYDGGSDFIGANEDDENYYDNVGLCGEYDNTDDGDIFVFL